MKFHSIDKENLAALIDILTRDGARLEVHRTSLADITGRPGVQGLTNKYDVFILEEGKRR